MNLKLILALALCASPLLAGDFSLTTRPPIIYNTDYDIANRQWDATAQAYAQAPPDLLHLSCVAPYNFRMGPVAALGNQDVNVRDPDSKLRQRIPPEEVVQRAAMLKEATEKLHKAGVGRIVPYICLMTLVGDHEKRLGFWDFYDHWDEYRRIGLYEKPKTDPFAWNQQDPDGKPRYFYPHDIALFRPLYRYATSPAHPDWNRWIAFCVQETAKTGMDGVFVDNSSACRDFSPAAQQGF
ncbi:MAG: hypothetical protein FJ272_03170, partial [Planctomycetes bacterium]|nr:hypothetical protein [Planctomycetota bacterium]